MDWNQIAPGCVQEDVATLSCLPALFQNIVSAALLFAGVVALFLIIISGIKFITSGGDPKQVEGARHTMTYAIIGLIIILLSFFIINVIAKVFVPNNPGCITLFGFTNCQ